jgi:VanZ family protein
MAKSRWKLRRETVWPFLLAGTITLCSGFPAAVPDVTFLSPDKLGHFAAYGALATAIIRHPSLARWPWPRLWWALPLASAYGLGDEFRQSLTAGIRQYDLADWAADTAGAMVAVILYVRWAGYRRLMETPFWKKRTKPDNSSESGWPQKAQESQK